MSTLSPYPWTSDEYGKVRDANGKQVVLNGFSLTCGPRRDPSDPCYANTLAAIAAPELLKAAKMAVDLLALIHDETGKVGSALIAAIAKAEGKS